MPTTSTEEILQDNKNLKMNTSPKPDHKHGRENEGNNEEDKTDNKKPKAINTTELPLYSSSSVEDEELVFQYYHDIAERKTYTAKDVYTLNSMKTNIIDYEKHIDDKVILGIVLSASKQKGGPDVPYHSGGKRGNEKMLYDRMLYIANIQDDFNSSCAAVIFDKELESKNQLKYFFEWNLPVVGTMVLIVEGSWEKGTYLGGEDTNIMILKNIEPGSILPLKPYYWPNKNIPIQLDEKTNMKWFFYNSIKVMVNQIYIEPACGGSMCDRLLSEHNKGGNCFCTMKSGDNKFVIKCRLILNLNDTDDSTEQDIIIENFTSWRFSQLFLQNDSFSNESLKKFRNSELQKKFRQHVYKYMDEINNAGGFRVVGWFRQAVSKGTKKRDPFQTTITAYTNPKNDDTKGNAAGLMMETPKYHISYISPSQIDISPATKQKMIYKYVQHTTVNTTEREPRTRF